ncbi:MAG: DUF4876 domain-containing protein [Bacteroidaceae bacterium]
MRKTTKKFIKSTALLMLIATISLGFTACTSSDEISLLNGVTVSISYDNSQFETIQYANQTLDLVNTTTQTTISSTTDASGKATFLDVLPGVYSVSISHEATDSEREAMIDNPAGNEVIVAGNVSDFKVYAENASAAVVLKAGVVSSLVIAKFYANGVKDDNDKSYRYDYYFTIYNNSDAEVDLNNKYLGIAEQYSTNPFAADIEDYMYMQYVTPLGDGMLAPGSSRVFCLQAIDHTASASASVNLENADYEIRATPSTTADKYAPESNVVPNLELSYTAFATLNYLSMTAFAKGGLNMVIFSSDDVDGLPNIVADETKTTKQYFKQVPTGIILDGVCQTKYSLTDAGAFDTENAAKYKRTPDFVDTYTYLEENASYLGIAFTRKGNCGWTSST